MSVRHHVGDDLILAYASGELDEALSLLVATHLALCPACREALATAEALGGAALEAAPETTVSDQDLEALFARIDSGPAPRPEAPRAPAAGRVFPRPLRDYLGGDDVETLPWRSLGGGARHLPIATGSMQAKARLLYIPAGAETPEHGHRGLELTLVLSGSFRDGDAWFRRGDVEEADATVDHQPVAGPDAPCVCLAVTDAPLRFRSLAARLAQPFIGI